MDCHKKYEDNQLKSDSIDPYVWKNHFIETMSPKYLPNGWDIILIKNEHDIKPIHHPHIQ